MENKDVECILPHLQSILHCFCRHSESNAPISLFTHFSRGATPVSPGLRYVCSSQPGTMIPPNPHILQLPATPPLPQGIPHYSATYLVHSASLRTRRFIFSVSGQLSICLLCSLSPSAELWRLFTIPALVSTACHFHRVLCRASWR